MTEPPLARLEIRRADDATVVCVFGEIDLSNAAGLQAEIEAALRDVRGSGALDLGGVEYLDSQGLRLLHTVVSRQARRGLNVTLLAPADSVAGDILMLSGVAFETTDADSETTA